MLQEGLRVQSNFARTFNFCIWTVDGADLHPECPGDADFRMQCMDKKVLLCVPGMKTVPDEPEPLVIKLRRQGCQCTVACDRDWIAIQPFCAAMKSKSDSSALASASLGRTREAEEEGRARHEASDGSHDWQQRSTTVKGVRQWG